jgi:1,4-dihydroxy-6-naphthoate synthase
LLLTHGDGWDPEREVLVPGEFTTANFLLDFYAGRTLQKRYLPFDALYRHLCETPGSQGVVINEKRFSYPNDDLTLIQDLGAYWEEQTNLPIPLGAIVVRKSLGLMADMERWVRASLAWADAHREEALVLCRQTAGDLTPGSVEAHIALYVNDYTRDLGSDGRAAVEFFLNRQRVGMVK